MSPESNKKEINPLGIIIGGSVSKGLKVKLDRSTESERIAVGSYIVVNGDFQRIFGMITDIELDTLASLNPIKPTSSFSAAVLEGTAFFSILTVTPMLILDPDTQETQPNRGIPNHFATVRLAEKDDISIIFGEEDREHLSIGEPMEMEDFDVVLDLRSTVERSSGVFGKSGTGKTFLVRQLLAGFVKGNIAGNLIFDMHNEYGWTGRDHERSRDVKGLKQLYGSQVVVLTLDQESSNRRKVPTDGTINISYSEIEPEDIEILSETLNLTEVGKQLPYRLQRVYGKKWLGIFLDLDNNGIKELVNELNENESTVQALKRRLEGLKRFEFLSESGGNKAVQSIMNYLDKGFSVVLEFGKYGRQELAYILVANLLSRRVFDTYIKRTEKSVDVSDSTNPLVITIEEAHKFLSPTLAPQTIFGTIAREGRKYGVTLLVVDQRPSGIDEEIISQIGTKLVCFLDNEKDIDAVLSGISGKSQLKNVLSRLGSVQQALLVGHALPMPIVVKTKEYGTPESYLRLASSSNPTEFKEKWNDKIDDLFS
jgi:DNA helicase HerA-like ATPase